MHSITRYKHLCTLFQQNSRVPLQKFASNSNPASSSSSSSEGETTNKNQKREEAKKKLDLLLQNMIKDEPVKRDDLPLLNLAKPMNRRHKNVKEPGVESSKIESVEQKLVKATKDVAESLGGDAKQTESELLSKLLNPLNEQSDATDLKSLFKGMKIDKDKHQPDELSRAHQVRQILQMVKGSDVKMDKRHGRSFRDTERSIKPLDLSSERVNLFGAEPLGIFTNPAELEDVSDLNKTWNNLHKRELKLAVTHPPANYFQEMILWTEQGKLWKFPIDNEQGLDEEKKVYFTEHVFVEKHLEPWCPPKGPIKHFMELVCVGLSKNPYITVQDKIDHINWFKEYFTEKQQLLKEVEAIPLNFEFVDSEQNKKIAE